jgi:hypothetical protein
LPEFTLATIPAVTAAELDLRPPFIVVARRADDVLIRVRQL